MPVRRITCKIQTDQESNRSEVAQSIARFLCREIPSDYRPTSIGNSERGGTSFATLDEREIERRLGRICISAIVARRVKPRWYIDFGLFRERGLNRRPYLSSCYMSLHGFHPPLPEFLFKWLIGTTRAAFGFMDSGEAFERKHRWITPFSNGASMSENLGVDVGRRLPGIYWTTYFGPQVLSRIDPKGLQRQGVVVEDLHGGKCLKLAEDPWSVDLEREQDLLRTLGPENFFNLQDPNQRREAATEWQA